MASWLSARDLEAPGLRLFCLPHAGSGAAGFYRWKRLLPGSIAVCPVLLPGREARLAEPCMTDAAAIAEDLHRQIAPNLEAPYAIFGHSMGALLAYEWARRIAAAGLPAPLCLFASGRIAPQIPTGHTQLHRLDDGSFLSELRGRYGGEPEAALADPELRDVFLPILRSDLQAVETYRWQPGRVLSCDLYALAGEQDTSVSAEGLTRWGELTAASFEGRRFAGDHFYHFGAGQADLFSFIARRMEKLSNGEPS